MSSTVPSPEHLQRVALQWQVEQFYYFEADMLDERRFDQWIELFTMDSTYWAPVRMTREGRPDMGRPGELAFFDDDYNTLELRIRSMQAKTAWAEIPPSRTRRMISNVRILQVTDSLIEVASNFSVYRYRLESVEHTFTGRRVDNLRMQGDSHEQWKIIDRKIYFDHVAFMTDNISIMF